MTGAALAVDFGDARIGLAVTNPERTMAVPRGVVPAQPLGQAVKDIRAVVASAGVTRLVIGLPRTLVGGEGPQAARVRAFAETLRSATGLPVEFVDERFTSRDATAAAAAKGTDPDAEAARLILETWIDRQRRSP